MDKGILIVYAGRYGSTAGVAALSHLEYIDATGRLMPSVIQGKRGRHSFKEVTRC